MSRNRRDTLFTEKQIEVLKLRASGMSVEEIAQKLGVTRSDIHAILRSIERTVAKARNTLKLYAEILGGVRVPIFSGTPLESAILRILSEADIHGIKIPITSIELALKILRSVGNECIDIERGTLNCSIEILIRSDGTISIERVSR